MLVAYRFSTTALKAMLTLLLILSSCPAQEVDFPKRHQAIKERFKYRSEAKNKAVQNPPMVMAKASDLGNDEPVIGVNVENEARAYPLAMLFGGGGIFELLNDTCGGQPIAASW